MNKFFYLLTFCFIFSLSACKKDSSGSSKQVTELSATDKNHREQALSVIEHRKKEEPKPMAIMVSNFYEFEFKFRNQKMSTEGEFAGEWIKFNDDWTYTYGKYGKTQGSGKYHHSFDNAKLVMVDDNAGEIPVEYETKYGQEVIILVGRPTFGQNGAQMKLKKVAQQPSK